MLIYLSIILASCRPVEFSGFCDNLINTAHELTSFEVLVLIDDHDDIMRERIEHYMSQSELNIKFIALPKNKGYYSLNDGYDQLLSIADDDAYFVWLLNDEVRIKEKSWDQLLQKYVKYFEDDVFRLKLSHFKLKNYYDLYECMGAPDNYAIYTKRWLELVGGWGEFWGSDSWQECINYFFQQNRPDRLQQQSLPFDFFDRSIPIFNLTLMQQEAGVHRTASDEMRRHTKLVSKNWARYTSRQYQEKYINLSYRLKSHILANSFDLAEYYILDDSKRKTIYLISDKMEVSYTFPSYALKSTFHFYSGSKKISIRYLFARFINETESFQYIKYIFRLNRKIYKIFTNIYNFLLPKMGIGIVLKRLYRYLFREKDTLENNKNISIYFYNGKRLERIDSFLGEVKKSKGNLYV